MQVGRQLSHGGRVSDNLGLPRQTERRSTTGDWIPMLAAPHWPSPTVAQPRLRYRTVDYLGAIHFKLSASQTAINKSVA